MSLPVPLPGETIHSFITRIMLRGGAVSAQSVLRRMGIGSRRAIASPLGNGIAQIYDAHPELATLLAPEEMVWSHTLAPLFAVLGPKVSSPAARAEFADAVLQKGGWRARNPICGNLKATGLRECTVCRETDIGEFGVAYWHREHQIAPVAVCWRHGTRLRQHSWRPGAGFEFELPGFGRYAECAGEVQHPGRGDWHREVCIAQSFMSLLNNAREIDPNAINAQLCEMAQARGLMPRSRPSRRLVFDEMVRAYGAPYLQFLGLPTAFSMHTAFMYVRPLKIDALQNVVVTVLLAGALGAQITWPVERSTTDCNDNCNADAEEVEGDAELEACLARVGYILNRAQTELGIKRNQLIQRILRAGLTCPIVFGANAKFDEATVLRMIEDLRSGMTRGEVGTRYQCAQSFLDQLAIYDPELRGVIKQNRLDRARAGHREAFERYVQEGGIVTRAAVRKNLPGPMSFLARNDRTWLEGQLARIPRKARSAPGTSSGRARVPDGEADAHIQARLLQTLPAVLALTPPRRLTPTLAFRMAGIRLCVFAKLSAGRLPLTQALLTEVVDSEASFMRRRIEYAIKCLVQQRCTLTADVLRKVSGLALPTLMKHRAVVRELASLHRLAISPRAAEWLGGP